MSAKLTTQDAYDSHYPMSATDVEKTRLNTQYIFKKVIYGWTAPVPESIDTSNFHHVLDIAAGTCTWTLDFARIPEVHARLGPMAQSPIHISACDIDTRFFPEKGVLDEYHITAFQLDVTKPLPPELRNKYDFIHISLLLLSVNKEGWVNALQNCREALKVGGILLIIDADSCVYTTRSPPPPENAPSHDIQACLHAPGWVGKVNRIFTGYVVQNDLIPDLSFRLPFMIADAGLTVIESKRAYAPYGMLCRTRTFSADSLDVTQYEQFSVENLMFLLEHLAPALMDKGELYSAEGTKVSTEAEIEAMLAEIKTGIQVDGAVTLGRYVIAQRTRS